MAVGRLGDAGCAIASPREIAQLSLYAIGNDPKRARVARYVLHYADRSELGKIDQY
jgi:hypothetical protein